MSIQSLLILFLFLFPLLSSAYTQNLAPQKPYKKQNESIPHEQSKTPKEFTVVEGMVYCQSCDHAGSWSLAGAKPLALAKVGIACKDHKKRVWFYKAFQADKNGYYYAPIQGMERTEGGKKEIGGCRIHLLSSPDSKCNLLTNINLGIAGTGVGEGKKILKREGYEVVVYATPPLAFRPVNCAPAAHY